MLLSLRGGDIKRVMRWRNFSSNVSPKTNAVDAEAATKLSNGKERDTNLFVKADKTASFALAGCGWLTPFYFGVIERMQEAGYLTDKSLVAGTSGGSLGALVAVSGISPRAGLQLLIDMSLDKTFKDNIDVGIKTSLHSILPENIVERSNGRLYVCVTKLWPDPMAKPHVVSQFASKDHIVDTVAASCFIPFYSTPKTFFTKIIDKPNEIYVDGGLFGVMPPIGDIRVSPFSLFMMRRPPNIRINPSTFSAPRLFSWVLTPAPPDVLKEFYMEGYRAADEYIELKESSANQNRNTVSEKYSNFR